MTEKNQSRLALFIMVTVIVCTALWMDKRARQQTPHTIAVLDAATVYTRGLITGMYNHNGKTVVVKYKVGPTEYQQTCAWDNNPKDLHQGDSILIKYYAKNPNVIFTELDKRF